MDEERKTGLKGLDKWTVLAFALMGVVVIILLIVSFFFNGIDQRNEIEFNDDGAHDEEALEGGAFLTFENEYQLDYALGKKTSERILAEINRMISGTIGDSSQDGAELTGVIEETSLKKDNVDYGYGYYFMIDVSNGDNYQVWVRTGGVYGFVYDCVLVRQMNSENNDGYMNIVLEQVDSEDANRSQMITELVNWSKEKTPGLNIVLNVTDK